MRNLHRVATRALRCLRFPAGTLGILLVVACAPRLMQEWGEPTGDPPPRSGSKITAEEISRFYPSTNTVEEILTRHFPGLQLGETRNRAGGSDPSVQILGMGAPLYVIDGVPLEHSGGSIPVNPRDVESIEVLKYDASTSLYGVRGANGVIVIATKR